MNLKILIQSPIISQERFAKMMYPFQPNAERLLMDKLKGRNGQSFDKEDEFSALKIFEKFFAGFFDVLTPSNDKSIN